MALYWISLALLYHLSCFFAAVDSAVIPIDPGSPSEKVLEACPQYAAHSKTRHPDNVSAGRHQLPFQRPSQECRTYYSGEVEDAIDRIKSKIQDPDLFRLFENAFPNTLDTTVKWKGFAWTNETSGRETDEDLAFVITGDM